MEFITEETCINEINSCSTKLQALIESTFTEEQVQNIISESTIWEAFLEAIGKGLTIIKKDNGKFSIVDLSVQPS